MDGLWMVVKCCQWLWMVTERVMDGYYQWLWMVTDDYGWLLTMVIKCYRWLWMVIKCYQWLWMVINCYQWLWMVTDCLLYTSPSPRDATLSRMPSSA